MNLGNGSTRPLGELVPSRLLRSLAVAIAALLAGASAQVAPQVAAGTLHSQLTRSTQVTVDNVTVDVDVTWVTPELSAADNLPEAAWWQPGDNVLFLVSETAAAGARLPNVTLGAGSVLAVEGLGALPDVVQTIEARDGSRLSLVRFPVTPYQPGVIALNVPGHGVLVWDVADCITVATR